MKDRRKRQKRKKNCRHLPGAELTNKHLLQDVKQQTDVICTDLKKADVNNKDVK